MVKDFKVTYIGRVISSGVSQGTLIALFSKFIDSRQPNVVENTGIPMRLQVSRVTQCCYGDSITMQIQCKNGHFCTSVDVNGITHMISQN